MLIYLLNMAKETFPIRYFVIWIVSKSDSFKKPTKCMGYVLYLCAAFFHFSIYFYFYVYRYMRLSLEYFRSICCPQWESLCLFYIIIIPFGQFNWFRYSHFEKETIDISNWTQFVMIYYIFKIWEERSHFGWSYIRNEQLEFSMISSHADILHIRWNTSYTMQW